MYKRRFQIKETNVTIKADEKKYIEIAEREIIKNRRELEKYIRYDPFFRVTLDPYPPDPNAPEIVRRMIDAGGAAGTGPMAAVAGTIAELALEAMVDAGARHAIVDNGGDIALINERPVLVGIYAGNSKIKNLAFRVEPRDYIYGICTSSGTVGPSISFGNADAATVLSKIPSLADASATALGNAVKDNVESAFSVVENIKGVDGALVIQGEVLGRWGKIPRIVKIVED
ncbi:MAG: UPF0280 family protein [Candidatus Syntropharchaeia archaeon]